MSKEIYCSMCQTNRVYGTFYCEQCRPTNQLSKGEARFLRRPVVCEDCGGAHPLTRGLCEHCRAKRARILAQPKPRTHYVDLRDAATYEYIQQLRGGAK